MEDICAKRRPSHQKTYRHAQSKKGLVRYELQVSAKSKERFEAAVTAAAEEFEKPWDLRQRKAKARALIFDEITQGVVHDFFTLSEQITALKTEISALTPDFFKSDTTTVPALPEAIKSLPDDPKELKTLLAKYYSESQRAKQKASRFEQLAKQFEKLYDASSDYCDELKQKLEQAQIVS